MKKKTRLLILLVLAVMLLAALAVGVGAYSSGTCGENLTWTLDDAGTLTISGTGEMTDYYYGYYGVNSPWYSNRNSVKSVFIGSGVTSIGGSAFYGCTSLTSVTIGDGVTSIGKEAFGYTGYYNNSSNWENGVLYIGKYLIKAKTTLSGSYTVKDGTRCIADYAFGDWNYSCTALTSVTIGDSVTSIGGEAFYGCTALTNVTIGDSVTSIGGKAFYGCTALTSVTIGDSVTSIGGGSAFGDTGYYNNSSNWENGVLYIGKYLIDAKTTLSGSYTVKDGTRCIADYAFYNCTALTSVTIPDSVTSIGYYAFYNCTKLTSVYITDLDAWCKIDFDGNDSNPLEYASYLCLNGAPVTSVTIPDGVTKISPYLFRGCTALTSVTIPDSVTSIGNYAFYGCTALTSVTIGNGVTSIGSYAFWYCTALTSVTIPDSVTSIGSSAFDYCSSLKTVYYAGSPAQRSAMSIGNSNLTSAVWYYYAITATSGKCGDNLTYVYDTAAKTLTISGSGTMWDYSNTLHPGWYAYKDELTSVTIGDSVTSIGDYAFCGCTALTSVTIPDSVTSIGNYAFYGCTALTSVTIGNGATSIGSYAFYGCTALTSVYITDIAAWCKIDFDDRHSNPLCYAHKLYLNGTLVTDLVIPDGVTSIGSYAFCGCTALTSVTIPDGVTSIGSYAFWYCTSLTSVTIPDSVTSIGDYAFYYCTSLTSAIIGNGVTSISNYTFSYCTALTSVTIGNGVTSIYGTTFANCNALTSIYFSRNVMSIAEDAFSDCTALARVFYSGSPIQQSQIKLGSSTIGTISRYKYKLLEATWYCGYETATTGKCGNNLTYAYDAATKTLNISGSGASWDYDSSYLRPGWYGFENRLTSVTIPYDISGFGSYIFSDCTSLRNAYFEGTETQWNILPIDSTNYSLLIRATMYYDWQPTPALPYSITSLTVCDASGKTLSEMPTSDFWVSADIKRTGTDAKAGVLIAAYTKAGQMKKCAYIQFKNVPSGSTVTAALPIANDGTITRVKAFVVGSFGDWAPKSEAVEA